MKRGTTCVFVGLLFLPPLLLPACGGDGGVPGIPQEVARTAFLDNAQVVPPVPSPESGVGVLVLDPVTRRIGGAVLTTPIDNVLEVHVHAGAPGVRGDIVISMIRVPDTDVWRVPDDTFVDDNVAALFNAGNTYFNVHTDAHVNGEIRGQIVAQTVTVFSAALSGAQEVPPVTTAASGAGVFGVNLLTRQFFGAVTTAGISAATSAHVHAAPRGSELEATPLATLTQVPGTGTWAVPDSTFLDNTAVSQFVAGGAYVHVHTAANPGGEIRGQIDIRPTSEFSF